MPDWVFTAAWVFILVWFAVWETIAIVRKRRGDTLSEHVWAWFSLKGRKDKLSRGQAFLRFGFLAFWAWLTIHFLSGGAWL